MGFPDKDDHYVFFGAILTGLFKYGQLSYKHYILSQYVAEKDPVRRDLIGAKWPFSHSEIVGAESYLQNNRGAPRKWLFLFPFSFVAYQVMKRGPKFWLWKQQNNASKE
eukprot:GILI01039393.1.p1 GENE.GILI01039393.1~~GILI01039393.1.p1  ORF type:complete len:122 (-),score=6.29 GILI01039393.1:78-404(-)